jgi:hypothetical protein
MYGQLRAVLSHHFPAQAQLECRPGLLCSVCVVAANAFCGLSQAAKSGFTVYKLVCQYWKRVDQLCAVLRRCSVRVKIDIGFDVLQEPNEKSAWALYSSRFVDQNLQCGVDDNRIFGESVQGLAQIPARLCEFGTRSNDAKNCCWIHGLKMPVISPIRSTIDKRRNRQAAGLEMI